MKTQNRIIRVNSCNSCPFNGTCEEWKNLSPAQRFTLAVDTSVPQDFMLINCQLEEEVK